MHSIVVLSLSSIIMKLTQIYYKKLLISKYFSLLDEYLNIKFS